MDITWTWDNQQNLRVIRQTDGKTTEKKNRKRDTRNAIFGDFEILSDV